MADCGVAIGEALVGATGYFHADDWDNAAETRAVTPYHFGRFNTKLVHLKRVTVDFIFSED